MCTGFGCLVDKELNLWFVEPDTDGDCSHSEIIKRLGWSENSDKHLRHFVRVEFGDWTAGSFLFDEQSTLPGWCEAEKVSIREKCCRLLERCAPAYAEYAKVRDAARAEYVKVCDAADAEYKKVSAPAYAEYVKVCDAAYAEYVKVSDAADAEYVKVRDAADAEYVKVRDAARAVMVVALSSIPGYVPQKASV